MLFVVEIEEEQLNPLIVTSSLDCSFRLWCIESEDSSRGICLKEFYLYNSVEYFDILGTSFVFGLGLFGFVLFS